MKHLFPLLLFLFCSTVCAQQKTFRSLVVDGETGETLPYVSVALQGKTITLSNIDGEFAVTANPTDIITVRYAGFNPAEYMAKNLPRIIKMKPTENLMAEVTVMPVESIVRKVRERMEKDFKKKGKKDADYFFRLTNTFGERTELVESFVEAKSATNLRDLYFLSGKRYRQDKGNMQKSRFAYSNMQRILELGPMLNDVPFWKNIATPLGMNTTTAGRKVKNGDGMLKFYDIKYERLKDNIIKLNFKETDSLKSIMTGSLYVDAQTYRPLRMEAKVHNISLSATVQLWKEHTDAEISLHITYTHKNGFTEVADMSGTLIAGDMTCHSLLLNIAELDIKKPKRSKQKTDNLMENIDKAGYDSLLWKNDIVLRTHKEEKVYRMATGQETADYRFKGPFETVMKRLAAFGKTIPQEKIFIHMDNSCYFLGDTIRFAAYTRQTSDGKPSKVSGILYVELLNQDGFLVERKLIDIANGRGYGDFALTKDLMYSGYYELRAYTRWQLNWGVFEHKHSASAKKWFFSDEREQTYYRDYEKLYSRVFPVYDKPKKEGAYERNMTLRPMARYFRKETDKRDLTLTLFPEGGNLVDGVNNRVAFEAAWSDGEYAEGMLYVNNDSTATVHRGRGVFNIDLSTEEGQKNLERGVKFRTKNGETAQAKLPKPEKCGVALSVQHKGDGWLIQALPTDTLKTDSLALTVMHEGVLKEFHPLSEIEYGLRINNNELPVGVNQVTVFDTKGRVYADRIFFVNRANLKKPSLSISGMKDEYAPYEQVKLNISSTKTELDNAYTSLAVYEPIDHLYDNGNILTEMLLSSEVKGFIPDPAAYFERDDEEHRTALDLLMMTQGWRRFIWEDMAVRGKWDLTQPDERAPIITGVVYDWMDWMKDYSLPLKEDNEGNRPISENWNNNPIGQTQTENPLEEIIAQDELEYKKGEIQSDVIVHAERIPLDGSKISAEENTLNLKTANGRFRIKLPRDYGKSVLFLSAAKTNKWEEKGDNYTWIQMAEDQNDLPAKKRLKYLIEDPDYLICVDFPYPRFVKPYNFYQERTSEVPLAKFRSGKTMPNSIHVLREVPIRARQSGLRRFDHNQPAYIIDAYDLINMATDAGMYRAGNSIEGRTLFGDLGLDYPYAREDGRKVDRIWGDGIPAVLTLLEENIPNDSIYTNLDLLYHARKKGYDHTPYNPHFDYYRKHTHKWGMVDKFVIYTDYCPRMEGSKRYQASNLPEIQFVGVEYQDFDKRTIYRDRRFILPGISIPTEFYNPDYSKHKLPEGQKDYRRTLYWNPNLKLDKDGKATVTFYNNSRTTHLSAEANGQDKNGTLLTGKTE